MKVRIQNDSGVGYQTKITNAETGEDLSSKIFRVELELDVTKVAMATVFMYTPVVDVIADAEIRKVCPCCGRENEPEPTS